MVSARIAWQVWEVKTAITFTFFDHYASINPVLTVNLRKFIHPFTQSADYQPESLAEGVANNNNETGSWQLPREGGASLEMLAARATAMNILSLIKENLPVE